MIKLEHEIFGKTIQVSFDSFVQYFAFHSIKSCKVSIQYYPLATE